MKTLDEKVFASLIARVIPRDVNITGQVTFEHRLAELERTHAELEAEQTAKSAELPPPSK